MKKSLFKSLALSLATGIVCTAFATDDNTVRVGKVNGTDNTADLSRLRLEYRETHTAASMPRQIRRSSENAASPVANFSVQDGTSQESVWSENFDGGSLDDWTTDRGEGDNVSFTLVKTTGKKAFSDIDPDDKASLHIDGPYNIIRRTIGTITSNGITVPDNGMLHTYVYFDPTWNEYATLSISVSNDDFETYTELWNSKDVEDKDAKWRKLDLDINGLSGKSVKIRLTYGPGTNDGFNVGGYLGDFYVDGMSVTGVKTIDQINVKVDDVIKFSDLSTGNPTEWEWNFNGGTPEKSTDRNPEVFYKKPGTYDVTLKVKNADGESSVTKTKFVNVEGIVPVAKVELPADFREINTRMHMVAPLAKVHYADQSTYYPESFSWSIYSEYELKNNTGAIFTPENIFTTKDVDFCHEKLNKWYVTHIAKNATGFSYADDSVQVQFDGMITNFEPGDGYQTNFTDGNLTLPGANNQGITAWAERFSKPSAPMVMTQLYVNFTKAQAEELIDQISNVSFSLYKSEGGVPGEKVDLLDTWTVSELGYALSTNSGVVTVELSKEYVINDEFFIVIEGIPEKHEGLECAFAMAPMRDHGNTAYMLKNGEWRPMTGYLQAAPGGQTSLAVFPVVKHSVMVPALVDGEGQVSVDNDSIVVGKEAGTAHKTIFSKLGWSDAGADCGWCRITSTPGEYTAQELDIEYDALPDGTTERTGYLNLTDGVSTLKIKVIQRADGGTTGIGNITADKTRSVSIYDINGRPIQSDKLPKGIYIIRDGKHSKKTAR